MGNENLNISFALNKVTTEQFAIIEEGFSDTGNIRIGTMLKFGCDEKKKLLACFGTFTFQSDQKTFIIIEAGCHFQIPDESWDKMYSKDPNRLIAPKGFLSHLAMLTVGTARGILHAKTEGTCFNKYVLPTINVSALIIDDVIFEFKLSEV